MNKPYPPIASLVPHAPPMLLVDELLELESDRAVARVTITPASMFFENGGVPAIVMFEYMAQTIAAFSGAQLREQGQAMKFGFLVGCRRLTIEVDRLDAGDELQVEAFRVWVSDKLGEFHCRVFRHNQVIAEGTVSVYEGGLERTGASG